MTGAPDVRKPGGNPANTVQQNQNAGIVRAASFLGKPIDLVLSRLSDARPTGTDRWRAKCPAHDGKSGSSLSFGIGLNDAVLLTCWAGCSADQICGSLGLELRDLFPPRDSYAPPLARRRMLTAGQALDLLDEEAQLVAILAADVARGAEISDVDKVRALEASARVSWLRAEVRT